MVKTPVAAKKKVAAAAGKENGAHQANGKAAATVDRYAELEKKRSAFSTLSAEAKVLAAAAPPIKENAVPVGMRRSDAKNRSRYCDGIAAEPVAIHTNGDRVKEKKDVAPQNGSSPASKKKDKSIREMKAEMAKKGGKKNAKTPPASAKKGEKRKRQDDEEEEAADESSFMMKRLQEMANAAMEREITKNKSSKRARETTPSDSENDEDANALALVPFPKGTPHPASKKSRLSSGVRVEKPCFDVEEVPYTVEEPSEDDHSMGGKRGRLDKKKRHYASQEFAAFEREMAAKDPYNEEEDDDFEDESGDDEELTDEEIEEDDMSGEEEMEDEEVDDEDEDEEVTDEELMSSDLDEEDAMIRPEDIMRTITFDDDEAEEEEDEDEEEEDEEDGECEMRNGGCCDNSDCDEDGSITGDDEEEEEGFTSDSSSHISDDSYGEAFVDHEMDNKSVTMNRDSPVKKSKKGGAKNGIDFTTFPFKDVDSSVSAAKALDWLLSPCDVQTFFADFFQSTSLVVRRNDAHFYGNLFSTGAMTSVLREHCIEFGVNVNVALYENGVRTTHNGSGRAYPLAIGDAIRSGCSVQLTNPQAFDRSIWYLCETLQEVFHCFVGANTYITPAGASGFAPHWDEIDAFLLQVEGRKYWRVWSPESPDAELPLESSGNFSEKEMDGRKPAYEGWIEQGDLLYIPRGFIHQARTDSSVHSLHVTVSVGRQWTFSNLLQKLLPTAMEAFTMDRVKLRRQLPPGLLDMTGVAELPDEYPMEEAAESKLISPLDRHMSKFRSFVSSMREAGVDIMAREFMRTALPPALTVEEKQLSAWGNEGADLFNEKGASRITPSSEVRFIRRHGQRLLFASDTEPFVAHRMANARVYEGAEERTFTLTAEEEEPFTDLLSAYPEWTTVKQLKMKKKAKMAFLMKLFNNGLIMARSV